MRQKVIDKQNKRIALRNRVNEALKSKGMCLTTFHYGQYYHVWVCTYKQTYEPGNYPVLEFHSDTELETWFNEWLERHR